MPYSTRLRPPDSRSRSRGPTRCRGAGAPFGRRPGPASRDGRRESWWEVSYRVALAGRTTSNCGSPCASSSTGSRHQVRALPSGLVSRATNRPRSTPCITVSRTKSRQQMDRGAGRVGTGPQGLHLADQRFQPLVHQGVGYPLPARLIVHLPQVGPVAEPPRLRQPRRAALVRRPGLVVVEEPGKRPASGGAPCPARWRPARYFPPVAATPASAPCGRSAASGGTRQSPPAPPRGPWRARVVPSGSGAPSCNSASSSVAQSVLRPSVVSEVATPANSRTASEMPAASRRARRFVAPRQ